MRKFVAKPHVLLMLVLLCTAGSGLAADSILTKQAAIEKARSHVPGRILAADLQATKPPRYKVKVLQANGRLKVLHLHAKTGALLKAGKQ